MGGSKKSSEFKEDNQGEANLLSMVEAVKAVGWRGRRGMSLTHSHAAKVLCGSPLDARGPGGVLGMSEPKA